MKALLSVYDKTGIVEFSKQAVAAGYELISTGGTHRSLSDGGLAVQQVADYTGSPEILEGRVKTLHPTIYAGTRTIRVSNITTSAAARFCESVESGHSDQDQSAQIAAELGITAEPVRVDSQAKYAIVAQGEAEIYLRLPTRKDYQEKIWDHAAGLIVVEEAGGRITDVRGNDLDFGHGRTLVKNSGVIGTNGPIHDAVLAAVAQFVDLD